MKKNANFRLPLLVAVVLATAAVTAWMQRDTLTAHALNTITPAASSETKTLAGAEIIGAFALTDHNGQTVTEKEYGEKYKLVFFGFTHCPHICPQGLQKLSLVLQSLGSQADNTAPLFISVDPQRDTPDVMKSFVTQFDPRLTGLTGTPEQVEAAKSAFKVYAAKVANDTNPEDYMMDHSSYLYLMSPDNRLIGLFDTEDSVETITQEIQKLMQQS
jgi:protein SCO1/2